LEEPENYTLLTRSTHNSNGSELSSEAEAGEIDEEEYLSKTTDKPKHYRTIIPPKVYLAKYPYLEIPYDSKESKIAECSKRKDL